MFLSCVRSSRNIGFVADERRLNVAITRARRCLVVVGSAAALCNDANWAAMLISLRDRHLVRAVADTRSGFSSLHDLPVDELTGLSAVLRAHAVRDDGGAVEGNTQALSNQHTGPPKDTGHVSKAAQCIAAPSSSTMPKPEYSARSSVSRSTGSTPSVETSRDSQHQRRQSDGKDHIQRSNMWSVPTVCSSSTPSGLVGVQPHATRETKSSTPTPTPTPSSVTVNQIAAKSGATAVQQQTLTGKEPLKKVLGMMGLVADERPLASPPGRVDLRTQIKQKYGHASDAVEAPRLAATGYQRIPRKTNRENM